MEQRIVEKNQEKCIFFIKDEKTEFYLIIPNNKKLSIGLGIFSMVNDEFVKKIVSDGEKAIVIPVVAEEILGQINQPETQGYQYFEQLLSYLINLAYRILTANHIQVEQQIYLSQDKGYAAFGNNYLLKYQGRVQSFWLEVKEIVPVVEEKTPIFSGEMFANVSTTEIGSAEEKVIPPSDDFELDQKVMNQKKEKGHEPGFVSYVLLGVVVAIVSLVFLYFIL